MSLKAPKTSRNHQSLVVTTLLGMCHVPCAGMWQVASATPCGMSCCSAARLTALRYNFLLLSMLLLAAATCFAVAFRPLSNTSKNFLLFTPFFHFMLLTGPCALFLFIFARFDAILICKLVSLKVNHTSSDLRAFI